MGIFALPTSGAHLSYGQRLQLIHTSFLLCSVGRDSLGLLGGTQTPLGHASVLAVRLDI